MSVVAVVLNVAFVGAFIAGLAELTPWTALAACVVISVKTQFLDYAKVRDTSQSIKDMSRVLQKLLEYFHGPTFSRLVLVFIFSCSVFLLFSWSAFDIFSVILLLHLKEPEFVMFSALQLTVGRLLPTGGLRGGLLGSSL